MPHSVEIDDDVFDALRKIEQETGKSLGQVASEAARLGIAQMPSAPEPNTPFRTRTFDGGECFISDLTNTGEILERLEGPIHK